MLDVRLFRNRIFSGALIINLIGVFSLVGFIYFVSQHLQLISGLTPLEAGLWMTPGLILTMIFGLLAVQFANRFGASNVMIAGLVLSALAYALVVFAGSAGNDTWLLVAFCVLGLGVGMSETISNDLVISEVPAAKAGAASAISETAYEVGSVLGVAVLGTILNSIYATTLQLPATLSATAAQTATQTLAGAHTVAAQLDATTAATVLEAAAHAFDRGVLVTASLAAILALVAAIVVFKVVKPVAR